MKAFFNFYLILIVLNLNIEVLINNYEEYSERLFEHFIQHNTTIKLAEYFIKEMEEAQK